MRAVRGLSLLCLVWLAGCATRPAVTHYAATSVMTVQGATAVGDFSYRPAREGRVAANQIANTAVGDVRLDQDVARFVRDAVFLELRGVGIRTGAADRVLRGDVVAFDIDDLGYSVDWTLTVAYTVAGADGLPRYQGTHTVRRRTAKYGNPSGALNETVKRNIEALLADPGFVAAIR